MSLVSRRSLLLSAIGAAAGCSYISLTKHLFIRDMLLIPQLTSSSFDLRSMHIPAGISLRNTPKMGVGIYAMRDFKAGEILYHYPLRCSYHNATLLLQTDLGNKYVTLESHGVYLARRYYFSSWNCFMNHACEPNVKNGHKISNHSMSIIALKNISSGEEVSIDYDSLDLECAPMSCLCGIDHCRKIIRGFSYLNSENRARVKKIHVLPPYVLEVLTRFT